jgi:transmembrane sensor
MIHGQIFDEAAEWFTALREQPGDPAVQDRFVAWLRISPEHVRAYLGIIALWSDLPLVDAERKLDADALTAMARADINVVALDQPVVPAVGRQSGQAGIRRRAWPRVMAAACAVLVVVAALIALPLLRAPAYVTGIGELRTLTLPDGSKVEMNAQSRIRVRFSEHERALDLLSGQAMFQVVKDPQRVFLVRSGQAQVRAVGTRFDVYRKQGGTVVTVVEGRVAVTSGSAPLDALPEGEILLAAGEQVTIEPLSVPLPKAANIAAATAWTRGQLMFNSTPLSAVVEEFNRHNRKHLVIDEGVDDFPITAVFATTDYDALVEFLRTQPDLTVRADGDSIRVSSLPTAQ